VGPCLIRKGSLRHENGRLKGIFKLTSINARNSTFSARRGAEVPAMENAELPEEDSVDINAILDTIDFQTASDVGSLQSWQAPCYIYLPHPARARDGSSNATLDMTLGDCIRLLAMKSCQTSIRPPTLPRPYQPQSGVAAIRLHLPHTLSQKACVRTFILLSIFKPKSADKA
jgi:hypothetical protein